MDINSNKEQEPYVIIAHKGIDVIITYHSNKQVSAMTALGRPGLPEDIARVTAFLCTEEAGWIDGQRIGVSGGMVLLYIY